MLTQPAMYAAIRSHAPVLDRYASSLVAAGVVDDMEVRALKARAVAELEEKCALAKTYIPEASEWLVDHGAARVVEDGGASARACADHAGRLDTGVALETLRTLVSCITTLPPEMTPHRAVRNLYQQRATMLDKDSVDWALAEQLAWAACLVEGFHVRLSGQDVQRGTFAHRHAVVHDQKELGQTHTPLANLPGGAAPFEVCNSALSEFAVLGFEVQPLGAPHKGRGGWACVAWGRGSGMCERG